MSTPSRCFLFGGIASIDKESKTPGDAFKVAIAGPLVSFLLFVLLTGVSQWEGLPTPAQVITGNVAQINLVLTLFNLIPGVASRRGSGAQSRRVETYQ